MSLYDDKERCSSCIARLRRGGCTRWGWEEPPCERDYGQNYDEDSEDEEDEESN